ncbi:putative quinol monooxygenase [Georgenia wangjunii]|uniref:putative quinol monooxygenase n=1 Tax=Georgenia wangjunii TaxID=3117730 RepID=UPI002F26BB48
MVIVAGHLTVDPEGREAYLAGCVDVARQARGSDGCLDFHLAADHVDVSRINIFEQWVSQAAAEAFRGSGPNEDQGSAIRFASVAEYDVSAVRSLT